MSEKNLRLAGTTACLLVNSSRVERWHYAALQEAVDRGLRITSVLVCDNTYRPRPKSKHVGYYAVRQTMMTTRWNVPQPWAPLVTPGTPILHFDASGDGPWQHVPQHILDALVELRPDAVLKFGMGLLRDPETLPARFGVLSYHHGNPARYRGRPAGFYELLEGADHQGVMVQRLTNDLDAGGILAYASGKVFPHSYRKTLENAYGNGVPLLAVALENARRGRSLDIDPCGRNYRLPTNRTAARFVATIATEKVKRGAYGAMVSKSWRVGYAAPISLGGPERAITLEVSAAKAPPRGYSFLADPVVVSGDRLLCEGMDRRSGLGHLLRVSNGTVTKLDTRALGRGHLSYPHVVRDGEEFRLLPEMSQVGGQRMATLSADLEITDTVALAGLEDVRLLDPTVLRHDGRWWLFANRVDASPDMLFLWSSPDMRGPWVAHPANPVVIDVARARCAGPIHLEAGEMFRLGQDSRGSYGDGVTVARIATLTEDDYEEHPEAAIRVDQARGPHTVTILDDKCVIDFYREAFDPVAGIRRFKNLLDSRRA